MTLYEQMKKNRIAAMKDRNNPNAKIEKSILTTLLGELDQNAKRAQSEVTDDMVVQSCKKLIKANDETIESRHSDDLVKENEFLKSYLPQQLSEDELRLLIVEMNATNLGQIMGTLSKQYKGKFDGKLAQTIAKEVLSN